VNNLQHQKNVIAKDIMMTVMMIRRGVSQVSIIGVEDGVALDAFGLILGVAIEMGVGNCRLFQAVWVPVAGTTTDDGLLELVVCLLGNEAVGVVTVAGGNILLLESMVGVVVICHEFEPSGIRAND
jgi:hypothetical protein